MGNELGFSEAWIGEHHTAPWEPHPSPDLLVAQALMQTRRMRIGPGGLLMPYCTWRAERETGRCRVPTVREGGRAENGCSVNRAFVPSMLLGEVKPLSLGEINARNAGYKPYSPETQRAWEY